MGTVSSTQHSRHVVLLGDSTFDNAAYTKGGLSVEDHMKQAEEAAGNQCTLLAQDGSLISNIKNQLQRVPPSATHLIISVGGNNGLSKLDIVRQSSETIEDSLVTLHGLVAQFAQDYQSMVELVVAQYPRLIIVLCGIYNPCFEFYNFQVDQRAANMGVALYNDVIFQVAAKFKLPTLDLRTICTENEDFANPIEPSTQGGRKIVAGILQII